VLQRDKHLRTTHTPSPTCLVLPWDRFKTNLLGISFLWEGRDQCPRPYGYRDPIITQATVEGVIHLISVVMVELDVEVVCSKTDALYRYRQLSRRAEHATQWPPTSDITHEQSGWPRILLSTKPDVSITSSRIAARYRFDCWNHRLAIVAKVRLQLCFVRRRVRVWGDRVVGMAYDPIF